MAKPWGWTEVAKKPRLAEETKPFKPMVWIFPGVVLGLIAICAMVWFFRFQSQPLPGGPGKAEADTFLEKLRRGQTDQAWQSAGSDLKSYMGKETLRALVKKNPALRESAASVPSANHGGNGREIHEYLTEKSGKKIAIGVTLENGKPRVDSIEVN